MTRFCTRDYEAVTTISFLPGRNFHLKSVVADVAAEDTMMSYTTVLFLRDVMRNYVVVMTISCLPGNFLCQTYADLASHGDLAPVPIQWQMNFPLKLIQILDHQ